MTRASLSILFCFSGCLPGPAKNHSNADLEVVGLIDGGTDGAVSDAAMNMSDIGPGQTTMESSVTDRGGVTWTFSTPAEVGQFVTGDYYVIGAVTITAISPAPTDSPGRNGSELNIPINQEQSGWDDRVVEDRWDPTVRANLPIAMNPGDSLTSSVSLTDAVMHENWLREGSGEYSDSPVKSFSILTCLSQAPPADAFRPSYAYAKSQKTYQLGSINRALLPQLAPAAAVDDSYLQMFAQHLSQPWIDNVFFGFDAATDYQPQYGREVARAVGIASLLLMIAPSSQTQTDAQAKILIGLTQYGIDLYGLIQAGYPGWQAFGGHGSGRKWPIVMAGMLLGETQMAQVSAAFPMAQFGEDMHTAFAADMPVGDTASWTGATVVYTGHQGIWNGQVVNSDPSWGPYEHLQPSAWPIYMPNEKSLGELYRRCCTSVAWVGEGLAARLMNAQSTWNHDAFFAYADRWMTPGTDPQDLQTILSETQQDLTDFPQGEIWDSFVQSFWGKYR